MKILKCSPDPFWGELLSPLRFDSGDCSESALVGKPLLKPFVHPVNAFEILMLLGLVSRESNLRLFVQPLDSSWVFGLVGYLCEIENLAENIFFFCGPISSRVNLEKNRSSQRLHENPNF